jgi:hypothetical protein
MAALYTPTPPDANEQRESFRQSPSTQKRRGLKTLLCANAAPKFLSFIVESARNKREVVFQRGSPCGWAHSGRIDNHTESGRLVGIAELNGLIDQR